jgi:phage shock protein A
LLNAGADEDHARQAAEAVAGYDNRLATMDSRLVTMQASLTAMQADLGALKTSIHWLQVVLGVQMALILAIFGKVFLALPRP